QSLRALDTGRARIDMKAPALEGSQSLFLRLREGLGRLAPGVGEETQGAFGRHLRVDLAQGAGGEIARVGVGAASFGLRLGVEGGEAVVGRIDLAADLDTGGPTGAGQPCGDVGDGQQVAGDVLARTAIPAR